MSVLILPDDGPSRLIYFDVSMSVAVMETKEVTAHPVEDGSDISDYIIRKRAQITFDGFVTETPIERDGIQGRGVMLPRVIDVPPKPSYGLIAGAIGAIVGAALPRIEVANLLTFPPFGRVQEVFGDLFTLMDKKYTCSIVTDLRSYDSMVLTSMKPTAEGPAACTFTCTFDEIRTVALKTVAAPKPKEPRAQAKAAKGPQAPTAPSAAASGAASGAAVAKLKSIDFSRFKITP